LGEGSLTGSSNSVADSKGNNAGKKVDTGAARQGDRFLGTDKEHMFLQGEDGWYKTQAIECNRVQISIDCFVFSSSASSGNAPVSSWNSMEMATMSSLSKYTGGNVFYYPSFLGIRDGIKFQRDLEHNLKRTTVFEAVIRVRASRGVRITNFYGNYFIRGNDLLSLPCCNSDSVYGLDFVYDEPILNSQLITFQAVLLHTSSNGERRIRIHNIIIPVTQVR